MYTYINRLIHTYIHIAINYMYILTYIHNMRTYIHAYIHTGEQRNIHSYMYVDIL